MRAPEATNIKELITGLNINSKGIYRDLKNIISTRCKGKFIRTANKPDIGSSKLHLRKSVIFL